LLDRQSDIECRKLTAGEVDSVSKLQQIKQWILQRTGREIKDFSQGNLTLLIDEFTEDPTVQALLKLRKDSAKTSTAKIRAMAETVSKDGRIHGMMMYYGAHTGRWTSDLYNFKIYHKA
jgi:DNA polymerase